MITNEAHAWHGFLSLLELPLQQDLIPIRIELKTVIYTPFETGSSSYIMKTVLVKNSQLARSHT